MTRSSDGFSLIEVLAALVVLALVLGGAWRVIDVSLNAARVAAQRARAVALAEATLAEAMAREPARPGDWTGEGMDGMRWSLAVRPQSGGALPFVPPSGVAAYAVTVTVRWDGARSLTLSSLKLGKPA